MWANGPMLSWTIDAVSIKRERKVALKKIFFRTAGIAHFNDIYVVHFIASVNVNSASKCLREFHLLLACTFALNAVLLVQILISTAYKQPVFLSGFSLSLLFFLKNFVALGKGNHVAIECEKKCGNIWAFWVKICLKRRILSAAFCLDSFLQREQLLHSFSCCICLKLHNSYFLQFEMLMAVET